ncbi:hypothetical protein N24_2754 [Corynebacterium suranareeae]|uniref:Secreted protein n=1 Tax=Corynebacterium suranareeae TaxID=2506452 RepID=A0A160PTB0_9CORY|nr:hypothetical protein [Corynebacterium suranareeae]BAU97016.1 hypothetical protein N24_2754 [Corynebacterium suranareeae]
MSGFSRRKFAMLTALTAGIVSVVAVGCSAPTEPETIDNPVFIGISSDPFKNLSPNNSANLFALSADGTGGIFHELAPTSFPSMHRLGSRFIAPDRDSLAVFDASLEEVFRHEVAGLGAGTQSQSAQSPLHKSVAFSFNEGTAEAPYRHRIVSATEKTSTTTVTDQRHFSLTACDDGSTRWVEYFPDRGMEDPTGPGSARIVTLQADGQLDEIDVEWNFSERPYAPIILSCDDPSAYIVSEEDVIYVKDQLSPAESIGKLPAFEAADRGRFGVVSGEDYFVFSSSGMLTRINIPGGKVIYAQPIDLGGKHPISITFDSSRAYVVVHADEDNQAGLIEIDLNDPTCTSDQLLLTGFNKLLTARKPKPETSIGIDAIMPIDPGYSLGCKK